MEHMPVGTLERQVQGWPQLFTEVEATLDLDPASEAVQALAKRWLQLVDSWSGGNDGITAGRIEAFKDRRNWPPEEQEWLLAFFGLDPKDRTASMQRLDTTVKFIGRAIDHEVKSNLPNIWSSTD